MLTLVTALAFQTFAQNGPKAVKVAEFDDQTEPLKAFVNKTTYLIKRLSKLPKGTTVFIAVASSSLRTDLTLRKIARELLVANKISANRFELTHPNTGYNHIFDKTEFWLISKDGEPPYREFTGDCSCEPIQIFGSESINAKSEMLFFATGKVNWPEEFTVYNWSVTSGTIVDGQGTSKIAVRANESVPQVEATVQIEFLDNPCGCPNSAIFTTRFR